MNKDDNLKSQFLDILVEISEKMNDTDDIDELLNSIIQIAKDYLNVNRISLMLEEGGNLIMRAYAGFNPGNMQQPLGEGVVGQVAITGIEHIVNGGGGSTEYGNARSFMSLPVKARKKILGVLNVTNKIDDFFSDEDIAIARYIASQCGLAVERYILYREKRNNENLQVIGLLKSSVAHDISNLLGVIEVYLELLEAEVERGSQAYEYVEAIHTEAKRVGGLATDMLDFSKQKINLAKKSFKVKELVSELDRHNRVLIKDSDITIDYSVSEGVAGIDINADKERLFRVFFNLINNAIDALGGSGRIVLKVKRVSDDILFGLFDNGKGIKKENLKMLFSPYFTSGKLKGTGLGLAVVKEIVKLHSGSISVRSAEGSYTCFLIRIPIDG